MNRVFIIGLVLFCTSCAHNSGVIPYENDIFMISKQAATGFHGISTIKSEAIQEANEYCRKQGEVVNIVRQESTEPPYIMGNFPATEVYFKCVSTKSNI